MKETKEKVLKPINGFAGLLIVVLIIVASITGVVYGATLMEDDSSSTVGVIVFIISLVVLTFSCIGFAGLKVIKPNEALVLSLFGKYHGTIYEAGFFFVNPFCASIYPKTRDAETKEKQIKAAKNGQVVESVPKKISTKIATFANPAQKVNDKLGNPIDVSAIVIWKVVDATKAVINVDDYNQYLSDQADSAIRNTARLYPYDIIDDAEDNEDVCELTLRGSSNKIAEQMKEELSKRVENAGIEIIEVRLNQIAYSTEIAAAMLQRQQAIAVIAARKKIVEGAVSMVEMALEQLKKDGVVDLDEERKAAMVSNLLVVLCGNKEANPVVNTGSIY